MTFNLILIVYRVYKALIIPVCQATVRRCGQDHAWNPLLSCWHDVIFMSILTVYRLMMKERLSCLPEAIRLAYFSWNLVECGMY